MTDKQIIIDGVDVSGCEYFRVTLPSGCLGRYRCNCDSICTKSLNCEENNCIYKQLKAKEQECEELKSAFVRAECQIADDEILQCDMREAIEELKAENDTYKKMLEDKDVQLALTEIRSGERHIWYNKANKLSKTLTEIKEIAKNGCYDDCGMPLDELSIILQKISECEGNNEYS